MILGLSSGAKHTVNCLPFSCAGKHNFKWQTPSKHNKAWQLFSSIHFHRRNMFPFKWTIYWQSVTLSAQTHLQVCEQLRMGSTDFPFPWHCWQVYTAQIFHLKTGVITGAEGTHNLKAASLARTHKHFSAEVFSSALGSSWVQRWSGCDEFTHVTVFRHINVFNTH